jgi:hypothetical protein
MRTRSTTPITNFELLGLLRRHRTLREEASSAHRIVPRNQELVEDSVFEYLAKTTATLQTDECVETLLSSCQEAGLSSAQSLQWVNMMPTTLVEAHLILHDGQVEPPPDDVVDALLSIVQDQFQGEGEEDEEDDEGQEDGEPEHLDDS